jgi:hypothetical protein
MGGIMLQIQTENVLFTYCKTPKGIIRSDFSLLTKEVFGYSETAKDSSFECIRGGLFPAERIVFDSEEGS